MSRSRRRGGEELGEAPLGEQDRAGEGPEAHADDRLQARARRVRAGERLHHGAAVVRQALQQEARLGGARAVAAGHPPHLAAGGERQAHLAVVAAEREQVARPAVLGRAPEHRERDRVEQRRLARARVAR